MIKFVHKLGHKSGLYKFYIAEIQGCLSGGLLLAAAALSAALLELFVRDLAVARRIVLSGDTGSVERLRGRVERELEEDRQMGFAKMLDELRVTVLEPGDKDELRNFYDQTRVPLAHGLVRRLTGSPFGANEIDDLFSDLARRSVLENRIIEDGAIQDVQFVVGIMKKYQPWLLRRYNEREG